MPLSANTLLLLSLIHIFELPVNLINKDMLIGSTVTSISDNGNAVVGSKPVSYTHLDVYKRQNLHNEAILKGVGWIKQLKLRASIGLTENQNFDTNAAIAT